MPSVRNPPPNQRERPDLVNQLSFRLNSICDEVQDHKLGITYSVGKGPDAPAGIAAAAAIEAAHVYRKLVQGGTLGQASWPQPHRISLEDGCCGFQQNDIVFISTRTLKPQS
jgi:hypothetical protein